ncbi:hypothetical protein ACTXT7_010131 [Hymenolepis weldensis]
MSTTTVSLKSYKNSIQSPVVPVSSKLIPTETLVQAPNDDMKLHLLFGESLKVTNFMHSMPKSFQYYLCPLAYRAKQQSVPKSCLLDHHTNQIYRQNGQKEDYCTLASSKIHESSTIGRVSKVFTQNPGKVKQAAAIISYKDPFNCYRTKASCSHIDLSLAGTIQGISHLILSATTGTILNNLRQVPDDASCWCRNLGASSQTLTFPVRSRILRTKNGYNEDVSEHMRPPPWHPETPETYRNNRPDRYS